MTGILEEAHMRSSKHRDEVRASTTCGCFYCQTTFPPRKIQEPFDFDELIARISALVRRETDYHAKQAPLADDEVKFDADALCLVVSGKRIELSSKERDFMAMLVKNAGRVLSRERILNSVWGLNEDPMTNTVDVYVRRVREKLGPYSARIATVRGIGYRYM